MIPLNYAIDPLTLAAIGTGIGSLIGGGSALVSAFSGKPSAPSAPSTPPPVQSPTGTPDSNKSAAGPSFLAAAAAPQNTQAGQKSLLGQ